jgi:hypothetical protein
MTCHLTKCKNPTLDDINVDHSCHVDVRELERTELYRAVYLMMQQLRLYSAKLKNY